jgi:hypothetical protein
MDLIKVFLLLYGLSTIMFSILFLLIFDHSVKEYLLFKKGYRFFLSYPISGFITIIIFIILNS